MIILDDVDQFGIPIEEAKEPEITFEEDNGEVIVTATVDGEKAGQAFMTVEGDVEYALSPYQQEPFYDELAAHDELVTLTAINVEPKFRSKGTATHLMTAAMKEAKKRWPGLPMHINASPMGASIGLPSLIAFYEKFGFKLLKVYPEHKNALLWVNSL